MIVFGGTLGTILVSFPLERVTQLGKILGVAFRDVASSERELVSMFVRLAERARREGLLALEGEAREITDHTLQKGLLLVVDGTDPELVREIMESDVAAMSERHEARYAMFEAAGGFAPTMGIIGTVMGLVNVLSHLDKPDELGKSIATAFIATLYGVLSANVFWLPVGQRLKQRNKEEVAQRQLAVEGVLSVQAGDNPRVIREKLESFLPLELRGESEEDSGATAAQAAA
jgi:chemotaxis protein MotA